MKYSLLIPALFLVGCASQPPAPPPIVVAAPAKKEITIPPDPFDGLSPDVRAAIESKQTPTLHDGIAVLFPYSANSDWTIYCQPLRATEIRLNADESTDKDNVVIGDSVRWTMKIGTQAVMVEPLGTSADANMTTNLIIHTDKRSYHLMLRLRSKFMPAVQWYYPETVRRLQAARQLAQREAAQASDPPRDNNNTNTQEASQ